jgi:hypothetical protein
MLKIAPIKAKFVIESRGRFFERDAVLIKIEDGLSDIPTKH